MDKELKKKISENYRKRNIEVKFYNDTYALRKDILNIIPDNCSVGIGNSQTLKEISLGRLLRERGNIVYDKSKAKNKLEIVSIKKKALLSDWYVSGSNAISIEGHIVNIDHSGNRVAALTYGPDNVIVVVGENKITMTLEAAIYRAKNIAAPQNAKRAGFNPPCIKIKKCIDCVSNERVCNYISIIQGQKTPNRFKLFIVEGKLGF